MLWIKEHAMIRNVLRRIFTRAAKPAGNTQLARPREGFSHLYRVTVERLEKSGVTLLLGETLQNLQKDGDTFFLQMGSRGVAASRVVSTIPLERVQKLVGMTVGDSLTTVTLVSLFFSFSGDRGFRQSILYNFSHVGAWKRLTVYSDFYGKSDGREYFTAEVNADHVNGSVEDCRTGLQAARIRERFVQGGPQARGKPRRLSRLSSLYRERQRDCHGNNLSAANVRRGIHRPAGRIRLSADGQGHDPKGGVALGGDQNANEQPGQGGLVQRALARHSSTAKAEQLLGESGY